MLDNEGKWGLTNGLVGFWPMSGSVTDTDVIGSYDLTLSGGAVSATVGGRSCIDFNGTTGYGTVGSGFNGLVGASRFTYSCWLYQDNTADAIIFDRNQNAGAGRRLLYIYRYLNNIRVVLGDADETYFADSVFPATTWVNMVVRWDKDVDFDGGSAYGTPQCFFNGNEVSAYTGNIARTTALPSTSDAMVIGVHSNVSPPSYLLPFPGGMSQLRIYNRALATREISRLARIY